MKTITLKELEPFDILLYKGTKIFGKSWWYHCAWYAGRHWYMHLNFESTAGGPGFRDFRPPEYVCRIKNLNHKQANIILLTLKELQSLKYDWWKLFGHYFGWDSKSRAMRILLFRLKGRG
jgi:cell wall-associated NlpC family hydrolase